MRRSRRNDKAEYSRLNLNTREAEKYFVILFSEARITFIDNMQGNNRYFAVIYRDITDNYDKYQKNRNVFFSDLLNVHFRLSFKTNMTSEKNPKSLE